jgi:hypothetical protein
VGASLQRRGDWNFAYQVRPVVVEVDGRRLAISPHETQLLLGELGRLPRSRYPAAEAMASALVDDRAAGRAIALDEGRRRCLVRAVEGVRVRTGLPSGLVKLRDLLLQ